MYQKIAANRALLVLAAILLWFSPQIARAGGVIEFSNLEQTKPAYLLGYLARPDLGLPAYLGGIAAGAGPYPAVVVLHGCSGFSSHDTVTADQIAAWGYVVLAVDSLTPRGIDSSCGGRTLDEQALDAYAALHYLSGRSFVDPERVAVLGGSMGGSSVLQVVDKDFAAQHPDNKFRAAIAYYPICGLPSVKSAPTLILIGELDDTTRASNCESMVENLPKRGAPISLVVYPGAYHAFNVARFDPGIRTLGHRYEYNGPAAKDAETKVRAFLAEYLAKLTSAKPTTQ